MTLLTVIHDQFGATTELGSVDATAFLSIYLLLYPVLQWGVGGWLMAPDECEEEKADIDKNDIQLAESMRHGNSCDGSVVEELALHRISSERPASISRNSHHSHIQALHIPHLLNNEHFEGLSPVKDAGEEEFGGVAPLRIIFGKSDEEHFRFLSTGRIDSTGSALATKVKELSFLNLCIEGIDSNASFHADREKTSLPEPLSSPPTFRENTPLLDVTREFTPNGFDDHAANSPSPKDIKSIQEPNLLPFTATLFRVFTKVFQPPVIGALSGLFIASFPKVRSMLVNISAGSEEPAPLQWMFDGIYAIGQSAVPINMTILGINLSSTFQGKKSDCKGKMLPNQTMLAVIIGKMLVMPLIGITATWFLQQYFIDLPDEIDATCYLVMMIVFITPTANNIMVMVELSGSSSKEGMARLIGWQYVVSPVVLSLVLSGVVSLASCYFDQTSVCS
ncbi:hypothetical protein ACHAWX_001275 [Stephanocyclus meneghinianus]